MFVTREHLEAQLASAAANFYRHYRSPHVCRFAFQEHQRLFDPAVQVRIKRKAEIEIQVVAINRSMYSNK